MVVDLQDYTYIFKCELSKPAIHVCRAADRLNGFASSRRIAIAVFHCLEHDGCQLSIYFPIMEPAKRELAGPTAHAEQRELVNQCIDRY